MLFFRNVLFNKHARARARVLSFFEYIIVLSCKPLAPIRNANDTRVSKIDYFSTNTVIIVDARGKDNMNIQ